jgi:hypothetical protein
MNGRVVAGFLREITPPPPAPFERAFETSPEGFRCAFGDGTIAWLRPGPGRATELRILESRRQRKAPVYVELDDDLAIVTLRLPRVAKPSRPHELQNGDLEFELFPSQCIHRLVRGNRDFAELQSALDRGRARDEWLLVTGTDTHEIIHVAPVPPGDLAALKLPPEPDFFGPMLVLFGRWWQWYSDRSRRPIDFRAAVPWPTEEQAHLLFALVQGKSCATSSPKPDCMPFLYPDDGCKGRAHEMCRLIQDAGFTPRKIWIKPVAVNTWLIVATKNSPTCGVSWSHHVAPLLKVVTNAGGVAEYVIDPALFDGPALRKDWVARIQGVSAQEPPTTVLPWYFYKSSGERDDTFSTTNAELAQVREEFEQRVKNRGAPPYAGC